MNKSNTLLSLAAAAALAVFGSAAHADALAVSSYDMQNGDGQAHGGTYNYWDAGYTGTGNTLQDGLYGNTLSGGSGKLTDGVIATNAWYDVSNSAGTGQYVGWLNNSPTIDFHVSGTVNEIKLYVDNSHVGGVTAPSAIVVNGTSYDNSSWQFASQPQVIDLTGLNIAGGDVSVQLVNPTSWVFLSEAQFFSTSVPEPAEAALLLAGLGLMGGIARRRRG